MKLRPYQVEAYDAVFDFFVKHPDPEDNPLVAMPTGTGKAVVIGGFVHRVMTAWPGQRILMLTHVKELVEQNADKLKTMWPQAPLGIYSAGLGQKVTHMPVTFASVQSVVKQLALFGKQDIILIDEVHLVPPEEESDYRKVIAYFKARNPHVRLVGFSATIYRLGLGMLTDGGVFTHVCYDITGKAAFNRLIDEGYLAPLISMKMATTLDVSGVKKAGGEYVASSLQKAVNKAEITSAAIAETVEAAADRSHWLFFATGIEHAQSIIQELALHGIEAVGVWSKGMSAGERDANIAAFKSGAVRALVNVNVLTTGFDFPALDCIILLRPTNSVVLHVQIGGRGTRPFYSSGFDLDEIEGRLAAIANSSKINCLVLDFAGNTLRLGPINDPRIPKMKGSGTGDIPVKVCQHCGCLCHISAITCENCGEIFEFVVKLTAKASTAALLVRDEPEVVVFDVKNVTYVTHIKLGMPPSLKVSYFCGMRRFTEWICLEHHGNPVIHKARRWWEERATTPAPDKISEAIAQAGAGCLRTPSQIRVWINKKNPEILSYVF